MQPAIMQKCFIHLLPTETLCSVLKAALEDIVKQEMMEPPTQEDQALVGDFSFPNTMALVCRRWRDIVSSAPELWTRIFCVLPGGRNELTLDFQLKKARNSIPIDLTVLADFTSTKGPIPDNALLSIASHIRRLRSLRIHFILNRFNYHRLDALVGDAPLLECLRLSYNGDIHGSCMKPLLGLKCPRIRILAIQGTLVHSIDHRWMEENLANVEFVTISKYKSGYYTAGRLWNPFPGWIPCLILDHMDFVPDREDPNIRIGAEKLILRGGGITPTVIDDNCKTIALHDWDIFKNIYWFRSLTSSNTLEFDGCHSSGALRSRYLGHYGPPKYIWNGDTVTIINSNLHTIDIVLAMLTATSMGHRGVTVRWRFMWPRVTTLTLVTRNDLDLPVKQLKATISCRLEAAGKLGIAKTESNDMNYKGVLPITVLHVYGGPPLSCSNKLWFKKKVKDFVWETRT